MRYLLLSCLSLLSFTLANAQCNQLFFSEYLEGASNNKAIEIYNPTAAAINLNNYVIYRYNNGSLTPTDSLFPQDILAAGDVWIAGNPSAIAAITSVSDTLHTITFFNGDDALTLFQISPRLQLDAIGLVGNDPGINWPVGTGATSEFTLVRQVGIQAGNTSWAIGATQYDVYPQNTTTFLGSHTMTPCVAPIFPVIQFASSSTLTSESATTVTVTVNIANVNPLTPTSVDVAVNIGGTANGGGVDYTFATATLTWPANDSTPQTVTMTIVNDFLFEPSETVILGLQNATNNATLGGNATHTVTIQDNDFPTYPIGTVNTVDTLGVADSLGLKCWVHGVVYGVNMRPLGLQFTIIDATGGIGVFRGVGNLGYTLTETDSVKLLGTIGQFNGLTQINVDSIVFISTGNALKTPDLVTVLGENTESNLTIFKYATLVNPTQWTGAGSGFNVDVTDGNNTIQLRIDADVSLYSQPAPVGRFHVCGLGGQFDATSPFASGYQLLPRYDADIKYLPVASLGANDTICAGDSVTIGAANSGDAYLWSTGATTQTITVAASMLYSVTVTDTTLNEVAVDTIFIATSPNPTAMFTVSGSSPTFTFTDNSTNASTWAWTFGDGNTSNIASPTHTYSTSGTYTVTLIVTNACGADTATETVTVLVGIENAFAGQLSVYPNPNHGHFTVDVQGIQDQAIVLTVADQLGRSVFHQIGGLRQTLALSVAPGIYFVQVATEQGSAYIRVMVQ